MLGGGGGGRELPGDFFRARTFGRIAGAISSEPEVDYIPKQCCKISTIIIHQRPRGAGIPEIEGKSLAYIQVSHSNPIYNPLHQEKLACA